MANLYGVPLIGKVFRRQRIEQLTTLLGHHEDQMRGLAAQLLELTEPGDDLAVEVLRLLEALDG